MAELLIELKNSKLPFFQRLANGLQQAIRSGRALPGEFLPSSRELAQRFGVNRHTIMKACAELEAEGWIVSHPKKGYQVTPQLPSRFLQAGSAKPLPSSYQFKETLLARRVAIPEIQKMGKFIYSFPSGFPDARLFPIREFKSCFYDALTNRKNLRYGQPEGHELLQNQVKDYLRRLRGVSGKEIIITNGSQEAIYFLSQLLLGKDDGVAVEALGYTPALEALRFAGAKLYPIAVDRDGLKVEEFRKLLKRRKIKMIYTTPLHQYPTTVNLAAARRLELYQLCYDHDVLILEDDYDHEFHYTNQPPSPIAAHDPAGLVLYVSTFSKILFPSARVGFMAVPQFLASEVSKLKRISSRQNEQIMQDAIARWMLSGGFEKHLRKMRRTYDHRRLSFVQDLENLQAQCPQLDWITPGGGMALWLNTGEDAHRLADRARQQKINVYPETLYQVKPSYGTHLRLGFTGQTEAENREGLKALAKLMIKKSGGVRY
jgi:GntR family transcriptional regulator/MocR family aminotransferase